MKLLTLTYFSITEHNFLILDEIKHRLEQKIEKYILNYNLSSIQNLCLTYASHLSKISFSIYEIDDYADKDIVTFLKYYYFLENKNVANNIYQERMAFLKEAMNLMFFETENHHNFSSVTIDENSFWKMIYLEVGIMIVMQLRFSIINHPKLVIRINNNAMIEFEGKSAEELYKQSEKLGKVKISENENLYDSNEKKIIHEFKNYYGFDDKSLYLIYNFFLKEKKKVEVNKDIFKKVVIDLLQLNPKQWMYFEKVMFFNSKKMYREKMIKNVNCSLFATPFVLTKDETKVSIVKYTIAEAAMYLRRRIIYKDIRLNRFISNLIKKLRNEKVLPDLKTNISCRDKIVGINKDFGKDKKIKEVLYNRKNVPHEIDLFYKENGNLKIFDLKDYHVPFSLMDLNKVERKLKKESKKLENLVSLISINKSSFESSLGFTFKNIEVGILLTRDISNIKTINKTKIMSLSEFEFYLNNNKIR